jgi:signal peptidase I
MATLRAAAGRHRFVALLILLLAVVVFARAVVLQGYVAADDAMAPTLQPGDRFMVNKLVIGFRIPFTQARFLRGRAIARGDLVVFVYPEDRSKIFVRRVIGLPGDLVEIRNKRVYLNGAPYDEPYVLYREKNVVPQEQHPRDNRKPVQVSDGSYFLLGDNRDHSYDSRFFGILKDHDIRGIVSFRYWRGKNVKEKKSALSP